MVRDLFLRSLKDEKLEFDKMDRVLPQKGFSEKEDMIRNPETIV